MKTNTKSKLILSLILCFLMSLTMFGGFLIFKQKPQDNDEKDKYALNKVIASGLGDDTGASSADLMDKGGIFYIAEGTTYNFTGGTITTDKECKYGGAVYVANGGTFQMTGGTIKGCTGEYGGAIYVEAGGKCVISGGEITENTSETAVIYVEENGDVQIRDNVKIHKNQIVEKQRINFYVDGVLGNVVEVNDLTYNIKSTDYPLALTECCGYFLDSYCTQALTTSAVSFKDPTMSTDEKNINIYTKRATKGEFTYTLVSGTTNYYSIKLSPTGTLTEVVMPQMYNGLYVTHVADSSANSTASELSIYLSASITTLNQNALSGFTGLTKISLPNTITTIGGDAFSGCTSLNNVWLPSSLTSLGSNAFNGCSSLSGTITIPSKVTSIGASTFYGCSALNKVNLSTSTTTIGANAFYNCVSLKNISLPDSIKTLGDYMFYNCSSLSGTITIPSKVKIIPQYSFYGCKSITRVKVGEVLDEIKQSAFRECSGLVEFIIPANSLMDTIGQYAFGYCSSLKTFTIPPKVTKIVQYTFKGCSDLNNLTLSNVQNIGQQAFYDTWALNRLDLPESLTNIGNQAFYNIAKDYGGEITIELKDHITTMGSKVFYEKHSGSCRRTITVWFASDAERPSGWKSDWANDCGCYYSGEDLEAKLNVYVDGVLKKTLPLSGSIYNINQEDMPKKYSECCGYFFDEGLSRATNGSIVIAKEINNGIINIYTRTASPIGNFNFTYNPETNTQDVEVYSSNDNQTLVLPKHYNGYQVGIGAKAFDYCDNQTEIVIPDGVTTLGEFAFEACTGLTNITIPDCVTTIKQFAFTDCSSLESLFIPRSVLTIESAAFSGCTGVESVVVDEDNVNFDSREGCNAIITSSNILISGFACTDFSLLNNVFKIGDLAFYKQTTLIDPVLPEGIQYIGDAAFSGCTSIRRVMLPRTLKELGYTFAIDSDYDLNDDIKLETKYGLSDSEKAKLGVFYGCPGLQYIVVREGDGDIAITKIGALAFYGCSLLQNTQIFAQVNNIGDGAFMYCEKFLGEEIGVGQYAIALNSDLDIRIGKYAFYSCSSLVNVTGTEGVYYLGNFAFAKCSKLANTDYGQEAFFFDNLSWIGANAFDSCKNITYVNFASATIKLIPSKIFYECLSLEEVVLPTTIERIWYSAFFGCFSLKTCNLSGLDSLTQIDNTAFYYCSSLEEMTIPNYVVDVGKDFLTGCIGLKKLTIGERLKTIYNFTFKDFKLLTELHFGNGVTSLYLDEENSNALEVPLKDGTLEYVVYFGLMSKLKTVTFGTSINTIPKLAFLGHTQIETVEFEGTLIDEYAFALCPKLKSVKASSLTQIASFAFYWDSSYGTDLTEDALEIWSFETYERHPLYNLETVGDAAFTNRSNLRKFTFSAALKIGAQAFSNTNISGVTFTSSTKIGEASFQNCDKLSYFNFPSKLETIEKFVIEGCDNISSIYVPDSVKKIEYGAFANCKKLKRVRLCYDTIQTIEVINKNEYSQSQLEQNGIIVLQGSVELMKVTLNDESIMNDASAPFLVAGIGVLSVCLAIAGAGMYIVGLVVTFFNQFTYISPFYGCGGTDFVPDVFIKEPINTKLTMGWRHLAEGLFAPLCNRHNPDHWSSCPDDWTCRMY